MNRAENMVMNWNEETRRDGFLLYEPDPEKEGYLRLVRTITLAEAEKLFVDALESAGLSKDVIEYVSLGYDDNGKRPGDTPLPSRYRWIACYAVTGGSEGHYLHVDVINPDGKEGTLRQVFFVKTFFGMEIAQKMASIAAEVFEA